MSLVFPYFFTYNHEVYYKVQGLLIYTDLRLQSKTPLIYTFRLYDDAAGSLTNNRRSAELLCHPLEHDDEDNLIRLTVDFPEPGQYTFLSTEVKMEPDGTVNTRLYRKPQKRLLLLLTCTLYSIAVQVSSNVENEEYSTAIIDQLLLNNGYNDTWQTFQQIKKKNEQKKISNKNKGKNKKRKFHATTPTVSTLKYLNLSYNFNNFSV